MLRGRFGDTSGRPYIEGRLILTRLGIAGDVSFLVDTGADNSLLMPLDGVRLGIDYSALSGSVQCIGIGGLTNHYIEPATLVFAEPGLNLYLYMIQLQIAAASPDIMNVVSLLGRDVLRHWRMVCDPTRNRLTFGVLSSDYTVPVRP